MGCPLRSAGSQSQGSSVGRASGFKKTERRGFESRSCGKRKIKMKDNIGKQLSMFNLDRPIVQPKERIVGGNKVVDYDEFLSKFEHKKTTDDCYTTKEIYNVILDYVGGIVDLSNRTIVRPFYPGVLNDRLKRVNDVILKRKKLVKYNYDRHLTNSAKLKLIARNGCVTKIKKNECVIVPNLDSMTAIKAKPFGCAVVLGDAAANAIKNAEKCVKSISADCYDVNPSEREWNLIKQLD
jgi:hypothetical protein